MTYIEARFICVVEDEDGTRHRMDVDLTKAQGIFNVGTGCAYEVLPDNQKRLVNNYNLRINADGFDKADAPRWEDVPR